jgi:hypothetical protein
LYETKVNPSVVQKRLHANPFEKSIFIIGSGLGPLYTFLITIALSPFRCLKQVDDSLTLVPSPNLDCYDANWSQNWGTILLGLSYIILIPAYFIFVLWRNRSNFESNQFYFRYRYLISGLKPQFYWWNVYQLLRKTLLVMMIDLTNSFDDFARKYLVFIALLGGMLVETLLQPRIKDSASRNFSIL